MPETKTVFVPIALSEEEAANSLGIGRTLFRELVREGHLPEPRQIPNRRRYVWDRDELAGAFREWSYRKEKQEDEAWH